MLNAERLKGIEIFSYLRPKQIDRINASAEVIKLTLGQNAYEKGEKASHFFIVLKGKVELLYTIKGDLVVPIDEITPGVIFGSCACLSMPQYYLTAKSLTDSEVLKIETNVLEKMLDEDSRIGYAIQKKISEIYFKRYIAAIRSLREVVYDLAKSLTFGEK